MTNQKKILNLLEDSLVSSSADQTELILMAEDLNLSRFAENVIHQNIAQSDHNIFCRVVLGKKIGISSTNRLEQKEIKKCIEEAIKIAQFQKEDPNFVSLPKPGQKRKAPPSHNHTFSINPQGKALRIEGIVKKCKADNLFSAGAFQDKKETLVVVNSLGIKKQFEQASAHISLTVNDKEQNSGWAQDFNWNKDELDIENLAKTAIQNALLSKNPIELPAGKYTVILEEAAIANLLLLLSFLGFGAKGFIEKRSFMAGKIGEKLTGDKITIIEDPYSPENPGIPFDYEGVDKKRVLLIENGIAKGVVYDSYHANLAGVESTGHALPPGNNFGPYPQNLVMNEGDSNEEELVASTEKGILITHFWYLNYMNPSKTMVTGTTRDGTFLIENGKIKSALKNMRIGQSILEAFSNVQMMTKQRKLCPQYGVSLLVPQMKIENFNFLPNQ
ncbi:MAG: TldD/PmbA family protein [candidate division Zixibacteria bacterium]|nr:TldD/PmbA family protein [candidate division Zixibacteria bacterium]